jgi:hypothetical protein
LISACAAGDVPAMVTKLLLGAGPPRTVEVLLGVAVGF